MYTYSPSTLKLIIEISKFKHRNILNLGPVGKEFLAHFAKYPGTSTYQIYLARRSSKRRMEYKNVHKRIRRLGDLGLIENYEKERPYKKSPIPFRLTTGGIYYLLKNATDIFMTVLKDVLRNYSDNIMLTTILYPYIQRETLLQLNDTPLIARLCIYLRDCCGEVESALDSANMGGYFTEEIFIWQEVPGVDNSRLFDFLRRKLGFDWLEKAEITKIGDGNTIIISYRSNRLSIKLDDEKGRVILALNGKKIYELVLNPRLNNWFSVDDIGDNPLSTRDFAIMFFEGRIKSLVSFLVITFVLEAVVGSPTFDILSHDSNFMKVLEKVESDFRLRFQMFKKLARAQTR
jgi:hypothetical protein